MCPLTELHKYTLAELAFRSNTRYDKEQDRRATWQVYILRRTGIFGKLLLPGVTK